MRWSCIQILNPLFVRTCHVIKSTITSKFICSVQSLDSHHDSDLASVVLSDQTLHRSPFSIRLCVGQSDIHMGSSLSIPSIVTYVSKQSSLTRNPNKIQTPCSCGVWNRSQTCPLSAAPAVLTGKQVGE